MTHIIVVFFFCLFFKSIFIKFIPQWTSQIFPNLNLFRIAISCTSDCKILQTVMLPEDHENILNPKYWVRSLFWEILQPLNIVIIHRETHRRKFPEFYYSQLKTVQSKQILLGITNHYGNETLKSKLEFHKYI